MGNVRDDPPLARGLLRRCFDAFEMAYLHQEATFQRAVSRMSTLDDFEAVAELGDELLFDRDEAHWRVQWNQSDHFFQRPHPIRNARFHRGVTRSV